MVTVNAGMPDNQNPVHVSVSFESAHDDGRVSLAPLDPEVALRALLSTEGPR